MLSHTDLVERVKRDQADLLQQSSAKLKVLAHTVANILHSNSVPQLSPAVAKISIIHEQDASIESQVHKSVIPRLHSLETAYASLDSLADKTDLKLKKYCLLDLGQDILQRRAEKIDLQIRILEHTAKLLRN